MICAATETVHSTDHLRKMLAIESIHGSNQSVLDIFGRLVSNSSEVLNSFIAPISSFVGKSSDNSIKNSDYRKTLKAVKVLPFAAYQDTLIQVPEGFTGSLDKYIEMLLNVHGQLVSAANEVLISYSDELAIFLNNVDHRKSIKNYEAFYKKMTADRTRFNKEMEVFFKKDSNLSRVKLGSVMSRFGDLDGIFANAEKLEAVHAKTSLSELTSNVKHAVSLLGLIRDKVEHDKELNISGQMAMHISEGAYEAARYVELVSLACYNIEVGLTTVRNLSEQFNKITG